MKERCHHRSGKQPGSHQRFGEAINEDLDELSDEFYGYDDLDEDEDEDDDEAVYEITCDGCGETSIWMRTR